MGEKKTWKICDYTLKDIKIERKNENEFSSKFPLPSRNEAKRYKLHIWIKSEYHIDKRIVWINAIDSFSVPWIRTRDARNSNEPSVSRISPKQVETGFNGSIRVFRQLDVWAAGSMVPSEIFFCSRSPWKARYRPPMGQNSSALPSVFSRATGQMTGTRHSHAWMQRQLPSRDMANSSLTVQRVTGENEKWSSVVERLPDLLISLPGCKSEFLIATQRERTGDGSRCIERCM